MEIIKQIIDSIVLQYENSPKDAKRYIKNYIHLLYLNHTANGGTLSIEKESALLVEDMLRRLTRTIHPNPKIRG